MTLLFDAEMTLADCLMIGAVLIAPLVAVQVQKWLEGFREKRTRRLGIFKTLMATRASGLSSEHVTALNMIDLDFQGKKYKAVRDAWKKHLDHLGEFPKEDQSALAYWHDKRQEHFAKLLQVMGKSLGYDFDEVHLRKAIYVPQGHTDQETQNQLIRSRLLQVLFGDAAIKMDVASFPYDQEAANRLERIQLDLIDLLHGYGELPVRCRESNDAPKEKKVARLGDGL